MALNSDEEIPDLDDDYEWVSNKIYSFVLFWSCKHIVYPFILLSKQSEFDKELAKRKFSIEHQDLRDSRMGWQGSQDWKQVANPKIRRNECERSTGSDRLLAPSNPLPHSRRNGTTLKKNSGPQHRNSPSLRRRPAVCRGCKETDRIANVNKILEIVHSAETVECFPTSLEVHFLL